MNVQNVMVYTAGFLRGKSDATNDELAPVSIPMQDSDWAHGYLNGYESITDRRGKWENGIVTIKPKFNLGKIG